ncbi:sensor histidine kinase [bacterium]|nr:sensor histidine kinase [bacterium]
MKNKIIWKLSGYFAFSLLVFVLIISGIFISLFRSNTVLLNKTELENKAVKIAQTLSSASNTGMGKGSGGYGAYVKFLYDTAMADIWIVDEDLNIITYGMGQHSVNTTKELPTDAKRIVDEVFAGKTEFCESFSNLLDTPTLTVGSPITAENGSVIGAVLLHSPIKGIDNVISNGVIILCISIGVALFIAGLLSFVLSFSFTKPLNKMNLTAIKLANGDYSAKTGITQRDEIGTLAENMDILAARLDIASRESEKLEGLRRDFIANISHELRTPVTVIRGSLEALCDGVVTDENQISEYYSRMLSESKHLQRLVSDLLDLSRLQNTDFKLDMSDISFCDIISDVMKSAKTLAKEKNININFVNRAEACSVYGDYGRLRQMIMIVLDNAVKFSPQNGNITIKLEKNEKLILSVLDEGPGIPKEEIPYIFDRFHKIKSEENKTGTGLGLAIARQIAIRHNINLTAVSENDHGSEFIFVFN